MEQQQQQREKKHRKFHGTIFISTKLLFKHSASAAIEKHNHQENVYINRCEKKIKYRYSW